MTASALYTGTVRHRRFGTPSRSFEHSVDFLYADLDELPSLLGGRLVRRGPGLVRLRRRDLLAADGGLPVAGAVRDLIATRTGRDAPDGPVRVLSHPRTLGTCFNPISLYYAFDRDERLDAVIAEVTSTPWLGRHAYVLRRGAEAGGVLRGEHAKELHVSPFQPMDRRHVWSAGTPGDSLSVHIENHAGDGAPKDFDATLSLRRGPLDARGLARMVARHPAGTVRVLALIYGHAIALKARGATYFPPPAKGPA